MHSNPLRKLNQFQLCNQSCLDYFVLKPLTFSQIDQNAREDFNLTSDMEFNAIRSLVLGKVHGK